MAHRTDFVHSIILTQCLNTWALPCIHTSLTFMHLQSTFNFSGWFGYIPSFLKGHVHFNNFLKTFIIIFKNCSIKNSTAECSSTDNLLQSAVFYKILSLKLKELHIFLNFPFFCLFWKWTRNFFPPLLFALSWVQQ